MREQAEGIGVAVEVGDVVPGGFGELVAEFLPRPLREEGANGLFAGVTEGGIAHVVRQTGCRHDGTDAFEGGAVGGVVLSFQSARDVGTQGAAHARNFEGVRETVVDKNATREGKHLRLVLHAPKGRGKDEPVVVALEFCALFGGMFVAIFFAQAAGRDELVPIHGCKSRGLRRNVGAAGQKLRCFHSAGACCSSNHSRAS